MAAMRSGSSPRAAAAKLIRPQRAAETRTRIRPAARRRQSSDRFSPTQLSSAPANRLESAALIGKSDLSRRAQGHAGTADRCWKRWGHGAGNRPRLASQGTGPGYPTGATGGANLGS